MSHVREFSFHFCNNISAINGNLDATTISAFWVPGCPFKPLPDQRDNREEVMFYTLSMWVKVSQLTCCSKLFRTEHNRTQDSTTQHNTTQHSFTGVTMPKITVLCLLELPSSKSKAPSGDPCSLEAHTCSPWPRCVPDVGVGSSCPRRGSGESEGQRS